MKTLFRITLFLLCIVLCQSVAPHTFAEGEVDAIYTPGTYIGTSDGRSSTITVTITVDKAFILAVDVDTSGETNGIGTAAKGTLEERFLAAQSADIDGVTGATITSQAAKKAMQDALDLASLIPDFVLPSDLIIIEEEAFAGGKFTYVRLSGNTVSIGRRAFADCPNLAYIYIPEATIDIDSNAFGDKTALMIYGKTGSVAESYANDHHFFFTAVS